MHVDILFEKGAGEINEDFYCRNGNLFGVFDGATSLNAKRYAGGLTGGYLAAMRAGQVFQANDDSLISLTRKANRAIREAMIDNGVDLSDRGGLWSASAAVVRLEEDSFEWVQIGDSLIMVIDEEGGHEFLVDDFDHDLETLSLWKAYSQKTDNDIFTALASQIKKTRANQNVTYGVLNGEREALSFLNHGRRSLRGIRHILLFTDGLFIPKRDPETREDFNSFTGLFLEGGLTGVRDTIRAMEESDAGCRIYPRFKLHDDIAAFAISFHDGPQQYYGGTARRPERLVSGNLH